MKKLICFFVLLFSVGLANVGFAGTTEFWHGVGNSIDVRVSPDGSATIDTGCGYIDVLPGEWNIEGHPMKAERLPGLPVPHPGDQIRPATVRATQNANGSIEMQIDTNSPIQIVPGKSSPFPHCA